MKGYLYKGNEKGFTLVELMVAAVISIIVIMGFYDLYISQNNVYFIQGQITDMQQDGRVAMDLITREIRMAGCDPTEADIADFVTPTNNFTIQIGADLTRDGDTDDPNEDISFTLANNNINRDDVNGAGNQPIAENIVSLQFMYGLDIDGDGSIFTRGEAADDDEWVFNHPDEITDVDAIGGAIDEFGGNSATDTINDFLDLIKITIVVRSDKPDPDWTTGVDENGNCCGGYRLRTLNSYVRPRNLRL